MAKAPTLSDIRNLILDNHKEVQTRLGAVEEQVRLTNGRVKALETDAAVMKGIENYKAEQEAQSGSNLKRLSQIMVWLVPLLLAVAGALYWAGRISK